MTTNLNDWPSHWNDIDFVDWDEATAPAAHFARPSFFNFSTKKVGGLRFVKLGRFCFSFCITKEFRPL